MTKKVSLCQITNNLYLKLTCGARFFQFISFKWQRGASIAESIKNTVCDNVISYVLSLTYYVHKIRNMKLASIVQGDRYFADICPRLSTSATVQRGNQIT